MRVGFKINLRKCKLLVHSCTLLGCIVSALQLALGDKYRWGLAGFDPHQLAAAAECLGQAPVGSALYTKLQAHCGAG